ncbi:hypothetical protein TNCV_4386331 [Trichonephila clavipes]|nr:hypothetical protein TNCV_4386331 [Trichonephila clavipes]
MPNFHTMSMWDFESRRIYRSSSHLHGGVLLAPKLETRTPQGQHRSQVHDHSTCAVLKLIGYRLKNIYSRTFI